MIIKLTFSIEFGWTSLSLYLLPPAVGCGFSLFEISLNGDLTEGGPSHIILGLFAISLCTEVPALWCCPRNLRPNVIELINRNVTTSWYMGECKSCYSILDSFSSF